MARNINLIIIYSNITMEIYVKENDAHKSWIRHKKTLLKFQREIKFQKVRNQLSFICLGDKFQGSASNLRATFIHTSSPQFYRVLFRIKTFIIKFYVHLFIAVKNCSFWWFNSRINLASYLVLLSKRNKTYRKTGAFWESDISFSSG